MAIDLLKLVTVKNSNFSSKAGFVAGNQKEFTHNRSDFFESETRMTASILKQDSNTLKVQKNAIY